MNRVKQQRCVIGINGQIPDPDYPVDIWFDSLKSFANVLSKENQHLLKVIAEQQPQSVTELAVLTGRAVSNVSRTLKTLDSLGIVSLVRTSGQVKPTTKFRSFIVVGNYCE
ncbi:MULTISPECIES: HVO_A0114 family putative DNA-binding protein [Aeromonas]|uniref:HVO_A0114 family putative DNA-binding protein n=1 Tax=Aeromonas TaxID=642 RepID=UPI0022E7111B|nr:helix-turn-helix domain-containing protein [Aeromonas sp. QDB08]